MLTARDDVFDKVLGLELGADDYITKPFRIKEVLTRIKISLRRIEKYSLASSSTFISINSIVKINYESRLVLKNDNEIILKPKEYELLEFLPQNRNRVFTISCLDGTKFDFSKLEKKECKNIKQFLEKKVSDEYLVTQPSVLNAIGKKGIKRATIIKDYCYTITERQDRCPAQVIALENGLYRYLTDKECWLLQGYSEEDYLNAAKVNSKRTLYKQSGNSIPVTIFESIFKQILNI